MKKTFLIILMFSFIFLFFSCPNDSVEENPEEQLSSILEETPSFYVCDLTSLTTTIKEDEIKNYYIVAKIPEDKTAEEYIDIRPMIYKEWKEGAVNTVTTSENEGARCISLTTPASNIWDVFLASQTIWNFEENTNYKVSFEAKAATEGERILTELKDSLKSERGGNTCTSLTTEFKTYSFETGSYNKAWKGHLQIAIGFLTSEICIKNLKIEKIEGTSLPYGIHLGSKDDKISTAKIENGVTFSFETLNPDTTPNSSWPIINTGFAIEDNKLYEVTFNASANEKDVTLKVGAYSIDSNYSNSWKITTIGTKPISIKMYVLGAVINDEKYRFLELHFNTPKNNSVTITDVKVSEVTKTPQDVDLFVKLNDKYGEITSEIPYAIAKIPVGESFTFDMCFSTINSKQINYDDFTRISGFTKESPESLDILNSPKANGEIERKFTNNTDSDKYYKISLNSNWKIILEETEFSIIDGSNP